MADSKSHTTVDHDEIRKFVESKGGIPAFVRDTGVLRIDFPGGAGEEKFEHLDWDKFFKAFEDNNLAMVYQVETAEGRPSNFLRFVQREVGDAKGGTHKTTHADKPHDTDDDAQSAPNKDEDYKKKQTKGTTARNDNDDDSGDKHPDTKGGKKTKDPEQRGGSEREKGEHKSDKNDNKKSGNETPNKKSTDAKKKH